jgi:CBS domain-containing protein
VTAADIMRTDIITVSTSSPLSEVERVLSENRIGGAPVVDHTGHIVGVVSARDLLDRYTEDPDAQPMRGPGWFHMGFEEYDFDDEELVDLQVPEGTEETASDVMNREVFSVPAAADLRDIAGTMVKHRVHRVLVERDGRHVGILSTLDILNALGS